MRAQAAQPPGELTAGELGAGELDNTKDNDFAASEFAMMLSEI